MGDAGLAPFIDGGMNLPPERSSGSGGFTADSNSVITSPQHCNHFVGVERSRSADLHSTVFPHTWQRSRPTYSAGGGTSFESSSAGTSTLRDVVKRKVG
jgi:hypothetical protein